MDIERLRALEKAVELVAKATPGPWLYRATSNTFHGPPPEGTNYSFGYSIMDPDEDYPAFKHEDIDALLAAVNFIREHGSALIAELGQEVGAVALIEAARDWIAKAPHGDNCYLDPDHAYGNSCYCGKESILSVLESPAHTSEARDAALVDELVQASLALQMAKALTSLPLKNEFAKRNGMASHYEVEAWMLNAHRRFDAALAAMRQEGGNAD